MHGVALQSQGSQCVFNLQEDFLFVKFDSRTMESCWTSAAVSEYTTHVPYAASQADLADKSLRRPSDRDGDKSQ